MSHPESPDVRPTTGPRPASVAIIGSGSAGSVTAYRLRQLLGPAARITVYEKARRVGGRAHSVEFAGARVEVGGTLIHSSNRRLGDLLVAAGLEAATPDLDVDGRDEVVAVWDGAAFVFRTKTTSAAMAWRLVRACGIRGLWRLRGEAGRVRDAVTRIYDLQDKGQLYDSPQDLLAAVELAPLIDRSLRETLAQQYIRPIFIEGLIEGILRNMYNQDAALNALAGYVALIGGGFGGGSLYSVRGGNAQLFQRAIELARAELLLGREVRTIAPAETTRDRWYAITDTRGVVELVDAVVIAAPLVGNALDLSMIALREDPRGPRRLQTVHTTLVAGDLSHRYFGLDEATSAPSHILTTANPELPFKSIGVTGHSPQHQCRIYKIFSADAIPDELVTQLFRVVRETRRLVWQAYPVLEPALPPPSFELADRLFYVNAFESAVSTLETEAMAGWNVAGLVARKLGTPAA